MLAPKIEAYSGETVYTISYLNFDASGQPLFIIKGSIQNHSNNRVWVTKGLLKANA